MPSGNTSLLPWTPTNNASQTATQYKNSIDADSSIAGNVAGQLSVYPNTPVGLSVLVDTGFDFWSGSSGYIQQAGSTSPATVTLTAPTTNPYWACIYYDPNANTCGVVYGAQATTPVPRFPETWAVWPLALIQLGVGQTTVSASQIRDIRGLHLSMRPVFLELPSVAGNTSVDLSGIRKVCIDLTSSANFTLSLLNVGYHTEIDISAQAAGGGGVTKVMKVAATTPGGVSLAVVACFPVWAQTGAGLSFYDSVNLGTTGATIFGGSAINLLSMKSVWAPGQTPPLLAFR
jgi:hypothetical protein